MNRTHRVCWTLCTVLLAFTATMMFPGAARAAAYAFSTDFLFLLSITGGMVTSGIGTNTINTAEFGGFGKDNTTQPTDAKQGKSGPGPFPDENRFQPPQGLMGQYARSDSLIDALAAMTPGDMRNVAEAFRSTVGSADASALVQQSFSLRQTSDAAIDFKFTALPTMRVQADGPLDSSSATIIVQLSLRDPDSNKQFLFWSPRANAQDPASSFQIDGGVVTNLVEPYALSTSIFCQAGPCDKTYAPVGGGGVFTLSYKREQGQNYIMDMLLSESVRVAVAPEPSTLSLVVVGLTVAAIGTHVQRRRRARSS